MDALNLKTHKARFTTPLYLESGRILEPFDLVYETYGRLNDKKDNVIVVCHALTGSHHAAGWYEGDRKSGWWDGLIGSGKAIDTDRFYVICCNVIGSCFGSTGPLSPMLPDVDPYRFKFPVITVKDMVKAQKILFDSLGFEQVHAVVGGSMGGMQALLFGIHYPKFAKHIIALATTHATQPYAIAFNKIAQEAIIKDPAFQEGNYDSATFAKEGFFGLAIGRMAGHISFLSHHSMKRKFDREYRRSDGLYELFGKFQVESYLEYNGYNFSKWFDPLSYIYITKAINIFDLSRGFDSLDDALSKVIANLTLISYTSDMLFLSEEMSEIEESMQRSSTIACTHHIIQSDYGHDAFLVELEKFDYLIKGVLDERE